MASDFGNLGILYRTRDDLDRAEETYNKALELFKALGSHEADKVAQWLKDLRSEE